MHDPARIAAALEEIASLLTLTAQRERDAGGRFKAQTFERGAHIVRGLADQLATLIAEGRLTEIEGVGPSLSRQIGELWSSGSSSLLTRLRSEHPEGAGALARIKGMTNKRIAAVSSELNVRSIEELREACEAKLVRALPGFGEKTEQRLLKAIEELAAQDVEEKRVLLADALELADRIKQQVGALAEVQLSGAARRGEETLNQLELTIVGGVRDEVAAAVRSLSGVAYFDAQSGHGYLAIGVPLRVHFSEPAQAGACLLASTGSYAHLYGLRRRAAAQGLRIDEHGHLYTSDGVLHAGNESEEALYAALGLSLVPPELRTGGDELTRAEHDDFAQLLNVTDIQGMVHCHTTYSDGKHSIEEMARAAHALGMQYITITDHSPTASYAGGVTLDALKRQWDEIAEVQTRVPIRILRGTESDILSDGSLDYPDAILEQFEVVIASIHARHQMNRDEMTARLTRAMQLPMFKIWGHALGRLLLSRAPIACDLPRILEALSQSRGAVELSCDAHRLDLPPAHIPEARAHGLPFVISVDAHSTRALDTLRMGVTMARRGGVTKAEVLNTLGAEEFVERVRPNVGG